MKFDPKTGKQFTPKSATLSYTRHFAESLIKEAEMDSKIVAIHAAMGGGTGLNYFQKKFPDRCFDVGIAEQHAVTFAAGLAAEGLKPFCAIYSSFLQRGYDQVRLPHSRYAYNILSLQLRLHHDFTFLIRKILPLFMQMYLLFTSNNWFCMKVVHDVDLQKLPVRFAVDRAGLVGADGPTHCGAFDIAYMACLPNMVVMAPSDEAELMHMVATAAAIDDRPSCFRFPRGNGIGAALPVDGKGHPLEVSICNIPSIVKKSRSCFDAHLCEKVGKGRILMEGSKVAILGFGSVVQKCVAAGYILDEHNISVTVMDARFCKPLDRHLIRKLANEHEMLITVEEGSIGGFGSHVSHFLTLNGLLDGTLKVNVMAHNKNQLAKFLICIMTVQIFLQMRSMMLPDRYIDHGSHDDQIEEAGLSARHIAATVFTLLGKTKEALQFK